MNKYNRTKRYSLSAIFLVGQLAAVFGAIAGLLGIFIFGNMLVVLFCLVLCSCGIALAKFALKKFREKQGKIELDLPIKVDKAIKIVGYLSIGGIIVFGWFMFGDKQTAFKAAWPLYGLLVFVSIYILTFISASSFTAWKVLSHNNSQR